jgi:hypothetical protein
MVTRSRQHRAGILCIMIPAEPFRSPRPVRPARRARPPMLRVGLPLFPIVADAPSRLVVDSLSVYGGL